MHTETCNLAHTYLLMIPDHKLKIGDSELLYWRLRHRRNIYAHDVCMVGGPDMGTPTKSPHLIYFSRSQRSKCRYTISGQIGATNRIRYIQ